MPRRAFLYAAAIFLSSSLLFLVEPMAGKRVLPLLGGSAAVWITCLVFFQTALLLGYLCAHAIVTRAGPRMQAVLYGLLLAASLTQVALNLDPHPHASTARPIYSVLAVLTGLIGLPFLALSATSSLLQAWYARAEAASGETPAIAAAAKKQADAAMAEKPAATITAAAQEPMAAAMAGEHGVAAGTATGKQAMAARPPYRLFSLSNFGSLLALVVYPALVEPNFSLHAQTLAWSIGFLAFALLCGVISLSGSSSRRNLSGSDSGKKKTSAAAPVGEPASAGENPVVPEGPRVSPGKNQAAVPATSMAEKPLAPRDRALWLPMAACGSLLLSAVTNHLSQNIAAIPLLWVVPLAVYLLTFVIAFQGKLYSRWVVVPLLPFALGAAGYYIASPDKDVPIKISVPLFCAVLFIACLFCHGELYRRRPAPRYLTQYYLLIATGGALGSMFVGVWAPFVFRGSYEMAWSLIYTAAMAAVVLWSVHWFRWLRELWLLHWLWRLFWVGMMAALMVAAAMQVRAYGENTIVQVRSFYGAMRVLQETTEEGEMYRTLVHGTIQHGTQYYGSNDDRTGPTTYYVHESGVGLALDYCCAGRPRRVAVVGLGAGTLASYGKPGDVIRFYEIDPRVETIARNVFTYLRESQAKIEIVEGDARLSMEAEPPQQYDVIAVDAFSGDAIPVHLMTAEALRLYQRHLRPGGILAFHISNNFLDLAPVVKAEADHAGLPAVIVSSPDDEYTGGYAADWVLLTSNKDFLALPEVFSKTAEIEPKPGLKLWTDDYSSLWPVLKWRTRTVITEKEEIDVEGK